MWLSICFVWYGEGALLHLAFDLILFQMCVQVYLEIPKGEKLAEALHTKVTFEKISKHALSCLQFIIILNHWKLVFAMV